MTFEASLRQRVFVDASAYFAMLDERDNYHEAALRIMGSVADQAAVLVTSNFVIAETHALALTRVGRLAALRFLDAIDAGSTEVVRVAVEDEQRALRIIRTYADKRFSLTDATSFSIMDRLGIMRAFSFDGNFAQYGFELLSP